jgi:hypothetical protein
MTHNTNFFEQIEDYCLDQLNDDLKLVFEAELTTNPELRTELQLWNDIQQAVEEKEILSLRDKLKDVATQNTLDVDGRNTFEFLNESDDFIEITDNLSSEELINYFESLPKVHVYHHQKNSNENIHHFYKSQNLVENNVSDEELSDFDFMEFDGLEEAILEKDILQLRQKLNHVAKTVENQYSVEEIDEFLNNNIHGAELIDFERDLIQSGLLQDEVKLHKELEEALMESDILSLRNQLGSIVKSETSWNVSETSIEDFIDGDLTCDLLDEFNTEFADNIDLQAEVKLRKQINEAISESDIINLRAELNAAKEESDSQKVKMLIPDTKSDRFRFIRTSVAILVVLLGMGGVIHNTFMSINGTYKQYYNSPVWSPERSVSSEISLIQKANLHFVNAEYNQVIQLLDEFKGLNEKPVFSFYKGASFQNLGKFNEAINEYTKVIDQGDNLFVEEAQWYRCLCLLKTGDFNKTKTELMAVIERKGHFEKDAKAVLRRLKYSTD